MARRTRRRWTDEEKWSICLQTTAPDVSVAQVALRYTVNANLIFNCLRDPKYRPAPCSGAAGAITVAQVAASISHIAACHNGGGFGVLAFRIAMMQRPSWIRSRGVGTVGAPKATRGGCSIEIPYRHRPPISTQDQFLLARPDLRRRVVIWLGGSWPALWARASPVMRWRIAQSS